MCEFATEYGPVIINQAGSITASLFTTYLTEAREAGSDSVGLTISSPVGPWTAVANARWLHLSPANQSGTGSTNVTFTFDANPGATHTGTLSVSGQTLTLTRAGAGAPTLTSPIWLPGGNLQFSFTSTPGASDSVLFSTNLALPLSAWTPAGSATVVTPGQFQFKITPGASTRGGCYRVRSP